MELLQMKLEKLMSYWGIASPNQYDWSPYGKERCVQDIDVYGGKMM
jgi:hypothetical protein